MAGLALRCLAAAVGYGWFALDDYTFVVAKGAAWADNPGAPFDCDYRSTLMPRLFAALLRLASSLGASDPATRLQVAYAFLGLASCPTIVAVYHTARLGAGLRAARAAAWLCAAYVLMPRICTRALLESAAMMPLALAIWALTASVAAAAEAEGKAGPTWRHSMVATTGPDARPRRNTAATYSFGLAAASGALCGCAALVRFQVGIVAPVMALWAYKPGRHTVPRNWRRLLAFGLGGCLAAAAQAGLDIADGRLPLSTPWAYLHYNLQHASRYGESPFYTYFLQLLLMALPPACLWLGPALARAGRTQPLSAIVALTFVVGHTAIAHKEDRFMFPILPLLFVVLGTALADAATSQVKRARLAARTFWVLNGIGACVVTLSDGQRNWTRPLLQIARSTPPDRPVTLAVVEPDIVPLYYLQGRAKVQGYPSMEALTQTAVAPQTQPHYVLLRAPPDAQGRATLHRLGCGAPQQFAGDWVDNLLIAVNRHNLRRAPTLLYTCTGPDAP